MGPHRSMLASSLLVAALALQLGLVDAWPTIDKGATRSSYDDHKPHNVQQVPAQVIELPLLHDGDHAIPAFGLPAGRFFEHFGRGRGAGRSATMPSLPSSLSISRTKAVKGRNTGVPQPAQCSTMTTPLLGCENIVCEVCVDEAARTSTATCLEPASKLEASYRGGENATLSYHRAIHALFLKFEPSDDEDKSPCACDYRIVNETRGCAVVASGCLYFDPAGDEGDTILQRAQVWDYSDRSLTARSRGWREPVTGFPFPAPYPAADHAAYADAMREFRPLDRGEQCSLTVADLPPVVVVPGLTASSINIKLARSVPPIWAFWCEQNSDGWRPLWPIPQETAETPTKFVCWVSEMIVSFDAETNTFGAAREGVLTELVDFGGFSGFGEHVGVPALFGVYGWEIGKTIFGAPYDWRLPSSAQDEFFSKLKGLVELASRTNGDRKVVLFALSFGPQYTLGFLHRMTQAWKDQYIDTFLGNSPVFSGAPTALITYVSGYMPAGVPDAPEECAAFELIAGACFQGPIEYTTQVTDLAGCCSFADEVSEGMVGVLFNSFANNTCNVIGAYEGILRCDGGFLGYFTRDPAADLAIAAQLQSPGVPKWAQRQRRQDNQPVLSPEVTRELARASPSLMWTFPRAGTNSSQVWTDDEPLLITPSKNYTAFTLPEVLRELDISKEAEAQLAYLISEPDLGAFAAPGVDTFIAYGNDIDTMAAAIYPEDFDASDAVPTPTSYLMEDGDGFVPTRSMARGTVWAEDQAALRKVLFHKAYPKQSHANCLPLTEGQTEEGSTACWVDFLSFILKREPPVQVS